MAQLLYMQRLLVVELGDTVNRTRFLGQVAAEGPETLELLEQATLEQPKQSLWVQVVQVVHLVEVAMAEKALLGLIWPHLVESRELLQERMAEGVRKEVSLTTASAAEAFHLAVEG